MWKHWHDSFHISQKKVPPPPPRPLRDQEAESFPQKLFQQIVIWWNYDLVETYSCVAHLLPLKEAHLLLLNVALINTTRVLSFSYHSA